MFLSEYKRHINSSFNRRTALTDVCSGSRPKDGCSRTTKMRMNTARTPAVSLLFAIECLMDLPREMCSLIVAIVAKTAASIRWRFLGLRPVASAKDAQSACSHNGGENIFLCSTSRMYLLIESCRVKPQSVHVKDAAIANGKAAF